MTGAIAGPAGCAQRSQLHATLTIVGRCLQIDELHAFGPNQRSFLCRSGATVLLSRGGRVVGSRGGRWVWVMSVRNTWDSPRLTCLILISVHVCHVRHEQFWLSDISALVYRPRCETEANSSSRCAWRRSRWRHGICTQCAAASWWARGLIV